MAPSHPSSEQRLERKARCKAALGLLEAARMLVDRAETEGPKGIGLRDAAQFINRHIDVAQQKLLKAHDE